MDIDLLKTFLEVKNTRHFGKAAENLYLTQAAVSARVKQLEDFLGVKLFIRNRNNIQLTAEGERLVPHAHTMLLAWARARQDVALKQEQKHQLNIGSTAGLWQYVIQDKVKTLHNSAPALSLRAEAHTHDELLRLIVERTLDVAFLYEAPSLPELTARSVGKLKLKLVTSKDHISLKTALQEDYVYVDWGTAFAMFHAKRFGDIPPAIIHTNMASIAESFIAEQPGSAYLPESVVLLQKVVKAGSGKALQAGRKIYEVEGAPGFSKEIYLVYRTNSERADLIQAVVKQLTVKQLTVEQVIVK